MNEREGKIQCRVQQPKGLGALNNTHRVSNRFCDVK